MIRSKKKFKNFNNREVLRSAEKYDLKKNRWIKLEDMNKKRKGFSVVCRPDGIYAIGGFDGSNYLKSVEKYEFCTGKWKYVDEMKHSRSLCSSVNSFDYQFIYAFGGFNGKPLSSVERYDVFNGKWEEMKDMPVAKYKHQCVFINE